LAACVVDWQQTSVLVKRFWAPTANISLTRLETPRTELVAARGEPMMLETTQAGRLAEEALLFLRPDNGVADEPILLSASGPEKDRFVHRIKSADASLSFRVRAGDGQSPWVNVTVAERPELAGVRFHAAPPAYTGREPVVLNELPNQIKIVEGSTLDIALLPRGEVQSVEMKRGEDARQPLSADADGWHHFQMAVDESATLTALLTEKHGLENKRPPVCRIEVYRDQPPEVKIASPSEDMAARPDDEIDIEFTAADDFGIAKAELVIYGDAPDGAKDAELKVMEIPLGEQAGTATVNGSVPLDLSQFHLADGQSLSFAVRVYDTREAVASAGNRPSIEGQEQNPAFASSDPTPATRASDAANRDARGPDSPPTNPAELALARPGESNPASPPPNETVPPPETANPAGNPVPASPAAPKPNPAAPTTPSGDPNSVKPAAPAETTPPSGDSSAAKPAQPPASNPDSSTAANNPNPASPPNEPNPQDGTPTPGEPSTPPNASAPSPSNQVSQTPSGSDQPDNGSVQTGAPRPPDNMTRRSLDVAQSASSSRMRLNIDQWAGSFAAKQREKLEMMIAPRFAELDDILARAENRFREVLTDLERNADWTGQQDQILGKGEEELASAIQVVADLNTKSAGTPYAFIGLQLSEIADSHIVPANEAAWIARQAQDNPARQPPVETAWQQTGRARQRLQQLVTQYERVRREHHLNDAIQNIKTMYQAFVEDSFQLLDQQKSPINDYQRRMAELEVDEEYLKRLEEVLQLRQKLIAEFARILAEDPRLLRRFVDSINNQSETLRDQLTLLAIRQQELDEELRTWAQLPDRVRERATSAIIQKRLQESIAIAEQAAQLQERFHTWSPLDLGVQAGDLRNAVDQLSTLAATAKQLEAKAAAWRPPLSEPASVKNAEEEEVQATPAKTGTPLSEVIASGRELYDQLRLLDERLLELSGKGNSSDLAAFLVRRLAENRQLIARTSGWVFQLEHLEDGSYPGAAAVDQQQLAEETNELTADLADLEQQLIGILGREDNKLPPEIADLTRRLFKTLDGDVAGSQLGAVFSLQRSKLPAAAERTQAAVQGFQQAEELFDELIQRVIEEADKLPVQDPIADLLDDPTLDELLALLENEQDLAAALGIPPRPSNLQVIGDWLRRGLGGGGGMGRNMVMAQLSRQQKMLNRAAQRAANRTDTETENASKRRAARRIDEWNVLASQLEKKLLQGRGQLPPERYRRAIDQYFEELSRRSADVETQNP
ncbi:MAG: hypothetical protein AB7U20_20565, partial [Planctomycetaceae bacterium]